MHGNAQEREREEETRGPHFSVLAFCRRNGRKRGAPGPGGGLPSVSARFRARLRRRGAAGEHSRTSFFLTPGVRNRQPTQLLERPNFAVIYMRFSRGSPRGPAEGLNVCWYGNTAVADRGFCPLEKRESTARRRGHGLSTNKTGNFRATPCF